MWLDDNTRAALRGALVERLWPSFADATIEIMPGEMPAGESVGGSPLLRFVIPYSAVTIDGPHVLIPAGIDSEFLQAGDAGWARWKASGTHHRLSLQCSTGHGAGLFRMNDLRVMQGAAVRTQASMLRIGGGA
ncbi:MAG: hypothetical protein RBR77_04185 [Thauera sp.]|jgi:hypothetical protein|nr:hypothetical protein [Thauera sp.]